MWGQLGGCSVTATARLVVSSCVLVADVGRGGQRVHKATFQAGCCVHVTASAVSTTCSSKAHLSGAALATRPCKACRCGGMQSQVMCDLPDACSAGQHTERVPLHSGRSTECTGSVPTQVRRMMKEPMPVYSGEDGLEQVKGPRG